MVRLVASALALSLPLATVDMAAARDIPCTCRHDGRDMPEGSVVCIDLPSGTYLARCEKVLNNTAWRRVAGGCPTG